MSDHCCWHSGSKGLCRCLLPSGCLDKCFPLVPGAASTRVGNELGRGCAGAARRAAFTAVALELALIAVVTSALLAGQRLWAALFTDDAEVRRGDAFAQLFILQLCAFAGSLASWPQYMQLPIKPLGWEH